MNCLQIPDDFETNWSFVVCPNGKRTLVIAGKGITTAYRRNGKKLMFVTTLPRFVDRRLTVRFQDFSFGFARRVTKTAGAAS